MTDWTNENPVCEKKEELVKAFVKLILEQYKELVTENIAIKELAETPGIPGTPETAVNLLVIRSCPIAVFESFLKMLKESNPNCNLLVIGKAQDAQSVEAIYGKSCKVIAIEGQYSAEKILKYAPEIDAHHAQKLVIFSRTLHDGDYFNIYEAAAKLNFQGSVYCQDTNNNTYFIRDIKQYLSVLKLHKALCEWYWQQEEGRGGAAGSDAGGSV